MEKETNLLEINPVESDISLNKEIKKQDKPSKKEIEVVKKEFENAKIKWETTLWEIGTIEKGQKYIDYLKQYINNRFLWTQNAWMGVIKLETELYATEIVFKKNASKPPKIGYQALEFIFFAFQNSGGIGIQSAKDFEAENELYSEMFDFIGKSLEKARKKLENINFLKDKYAAFQQGYYYEKEPTDEEMEGSYWDKKLNKYIKPGESEYDIKIFMKKIKEEYGEETAEKVKENMEEQTSVGPPLIHKTKNKGISF